MIIAIDGPAASGKSTLARALAARLGLTFLDTGAMYRAVTLTALRAGVPPSDPAACTALVGEVNLSFDAEGRILIEGEPGEPHIRGPEVTADVSEVAAHSGVRRALVQAQQAVAAAAVAAGGGMVAEGRDTTSVVFPGADLKVFLLASPAVRAMRRAREEGRPELAATYEADLARRDAHDSQRADSPLLEVEDAVRVDTDALSPEAVLDHVASLASARRPG
jgi:cytidylate kinase